MANSPAVLLADEPTGELDGGTEHLSLRMLRDRAALGYAVLIVPHSAEAVRIADRVIALDDGRAHETSTFRTGKQQQEAHDVAP
ncbi:hypothetical protein ACFWPU_01535 [Streptomyces sp. NPDC058471]|uniref:hypothetical protein n=1 Tax=Streptomyces sp. NPDC058471 TaxID=3346516 RepID=UPI00365A0F2B